MVVAHVCALIPKKGIYDLNDKVYGCMVQTALHRTPLKTATSPLSPDLLKQSLKVIHLGRGGYMWWVYGTVLTWLDWKLRLHTGVLPK